MKEEDFVRISASPALIFYLLPVALAAVRMQAAPGLPTMRFTDAAYTSGPPAALTCGTTYDPLPERRRQVVRKLPAVAYRYA